MIISIFKSRNTWEKPREKEISFPELYDFFSKAAKKEIEKDEGPLFKLAKFGNLRASEESSYRNNENVLSVTGIVGDIDRNSPGFSEAVSILRQAGVKAIVKTSASYDPENKKLHVICPFSRELPTEEHRREVAKLNQLFAGVLSPESFVLSQSFYFVPGTGKSQDARVEAIEGEYIDELEIEPLYATGDREERHLKNGKLPIEDDVVRACREKGLEPEWKGNGVWAMYCPWSRDKGFDVKGEKHKSRDDKGAKYLVPGYGGYLHPAFHCHHGTCQEEKRGLRDLLLFLGLKSENPFDDVKPVEERPEKMEFRKFGVTEEVYKETEGRVYVMDTFAVRGEITVFWAKPSSGKTLLTIYMLIESIKAGRIKGEDVFYVNADDSRDGSKPKWDILKKHGVVMAVPGANGFFVDTVHELINNRVAREDAENAIIVLDTFSRFIQTMDVKQAQKQIEKFREFTAVGGTIIALGHTNKKTTLEGKLVHEGVGKLHNDIDASHYIEVMPSLGGDRKLVRVYSEKRRLGDATDRYFSFDDALAGSDRTYSKLFDSVVSYSKEEGEQCVQNKNVETRRTKKEGLREDTVPVICRALAEGINSKEKIRFYVQNTLDVPKRVVWDTLEEQAGPEGSGAPWRLERGPRGYDVFVLNDGVSAEDFVDVVKENNEF